MESHYHLRVTAGPTYSTSTHTFVPVNTPQSTHIQTPLINANLQIHINNYRGLPPNSPTTSPYFSHPPHQHDLYSIQFTFTLPPAAETGKEITGTDLVFGNDFDHPIRDHLPPGFATAFRIVRWAIDPGIEGDVYADRPYLYGALLSSINALAIHDTTSSDSPPPPPPTTTTTTTTTTTEDSETITESTPSHGADASARRKHFLDARHRATFSFNGKGAQGRTYACDFCNPYLDFNEFCLRLPGFTLPILRYWDGQPLRYVLKVWNAEKGWDEVLFVVCFALVRDEDVEGEREAGEEGEAKEGKGKETERETVEYVDEGVD